MNKHIVLGVSGSIAAFKAVVLASDMVKRGWEVRTVLTRGGARFVTPLTFEAITAHPVAVEVWDEEAGPTRMGHLELARWADVLAVCPASASVIARLALGLADDMLGAVALATSAPLVVAPAMESSMFGHPATQAHLANLEARGATIVGPLNGQLASGAEGPGRMEEPENVLEAIGIVLARSEDLRGWRVLVTAGPTFEPIDRVRFVGNRSSGKMGYALAAEAARRGAEVLLIAGPTSLAVPPGIKVLDVETADEMRRAVMENLAGRDAVIMAAAVADFRPRTTVEGKLKRSGELTLTLAPTPDIAAEASAAAPGAIHVGFALEAGDLRAGAREKMRRKGQHLVVANAISDDHDPFGADTNHVILVTRDQDIELSVLPKTEVARRVWDEVLALSGEEDRAQDRSAGSLDLGPSG
jgi:phosphopantothenoylcysteine decarboxylase/phosphopantothenate--cysteine ligase